MRFFKFWLACALIVAMAWIWLNQDGDNSLTPVPSVANSAPPAKMPADALREANVAKEAETATARDDSAEMPSSGAGVRGSEPADSLETGGDWYESALNNRLEIAAEFSVNDTERVRYVKTDLKYDWLRLERVPVKVNGQLVEQLQASAAGQVIVRKRSDITEALLESSLADLSMSVIKKLGAGDLYLVGFEVVKGRDSLLLAQSELSKLDEVVASAEPDSVLVSTATPSTQPALQQGQQWGLHNTGLLGGLSGSDIDALGGWEIAADAASTVVAVIDTGINYLHPDLASNLWRNEAEIPDNGVDDDGNGYVDDYYGIDTYNNDTDPADDNGHGTHCAGIIGADGFNEIGISGVAPKVQLMSLKFLSEKGIGFTSDALEALSYAKAEGADILNMSWGNRSYSESLAALLETCTEAGIIAVASAGNDADNCDNRPTYPGSYPINGLMTVASVDDFDNLSAFSNYGVDTVEIAAPGTNIYSTWIGNGAPYQVLSGTSMAAPHVAGVCALLKSHFPDDRIDETIARVLNGAEQLDSLNGRVAQGRRLNLLQAYHAAVAPANDSAEGAYRSDRHAVQWSDHNRNAATETEAHPQSVWYQWRSPESSNALIQFEADPGLKFELQQLTGDVTTVRLTDKGSGRYLFHAQERQDYLIVVYGSPTGDFSLELSIAPHNDDRSRAAIVHGNSWQRKGSSLGATSEPGELDFVYGEDRSVWWQWKAPRSGAMRIETTGSDFDTVLMVFDENPLEGLVQGATPHVTYLIDISGSAGYRFGGTFINDINGDGVANTILDSEIGAVSNLVSHVNASQFIEESTVSVIAFKGGAEALDLDPVEPGVQTVVSSSADRNANGIPDVIDSIRLLRDGGGTNYRAALEAAETGLGALVEGASSNLIFFSDGKPTAGGSYDAVVSRLLSGGSHLRAFGAGSNASLGALLKIDPAARIYTNQNELQLMISGALAYNDDAGSSLSSEVNFAVEQGKTYFIKVSGYDGETGNIRLKGSMFNGLEIVQQPASAEVELNGALRLEAEVKGVPPLNYQWFLDGNAIEGADKPIYFVNEVTEANAGDYQLMVSNTFDHVNTAIARVNVYSEAPTLLRTPKSHRVVAGANVNFSVTAAGTAPLSYQWYFDDEAIDGATASQFSVNNVSSENLGAYSVVVSNHEGSARTSPAYIEFSGSPFEAWRFRNSSGPHISTEQVLAHGDFYYLFQDDKVVRSKDGLFWQSASIPVSLNSATLGGEMSAVFTQGELIVAEYTERGIFSYYKSTDGLNWTAVNTPAYSHHLAEHNGHWYLHAYEGSREVLLTSTDLENWSVVDSIHPYVELTFLEAGSLWRYRTASAPEASNWNYAVYDSSSWDTGPAELGYGEGDEATVIPNESGVSSAYFIHPFTNPAGYTSYDVRGRVKYDTTVTVRFGGAVLYQDSSTTAVNPQGDWVEIPVKEGINLSSYGDPNPFSAEVGKQAGDPSMSFDLELYATTKVGMLRAASGGGKVIILKGNGDVFISEDGVNWTQHETTGLTLTSSSGYQYLPFNQPPRYLLGKFVGWHDRNQMIYLSEDGIHWEAHSYPQVKLPNTSYSITRNVPFVNTPQMLERDGQVFVSLNFQKPYLLASEDLLNWSIQEVRRETGSSGYLGRLASNGSSIFASFGNADFGVHGGVADLLVPQIYSNLDVSRLRIIDGKFVTLVADYRGGAKISSDTESWLGFLSGSKDAVYHDSIYYALQRRYDGTIWIRWDSAIVGHSNLDWTTGTELNQISWPFSWEPWTLRYFDGQFVAAGHRGGVATSPDAVNWELRRQSSDLQATVLHAEVLNGRWLGMTDGGSVLLSTDGGEFTEIPLSASTTIGSKLGGIAAAAYGDGTYVVCVENDDVPAMYRSTDGINWSEVSVSGPASPTGVAYGDGWFVAVAGSTVYFSENGQSWDSGTLVGGSGKFVVFHLGSFWISDENGVMWSSTVEDLRAPPAIELGAMEEDYLFNSTVRIAAEVAAGGAPLSHVEFVINRERVFSSTTGPFVWETTELTPGLHEVVIKVYDVDGRSSFQRKEITISYSDEANVMPGPIQHTDRYFQAKDGSLYGMGNELYSSINYGAYLARSRDGYNWKKVDAIEAFSGLRYLTQFAALDSGRLFIANNSYEVLTSVDGLNWQKVEENADLKGRLASNGERLFDLPRLISGYSVSYTDDGSGWQEGIITRVGGSSSSFDWAVRDVVYWNDRFVALGLQRGAVAISTDGLNWTGDNPIPTFGSNPKLVAGGNYIVSFEYGIVNYGSYPEYDHEYGPVAYYSQDGLSWSPLAEKTELDFFNIQSMDGIFFGTTSSGMWQSTDLEDWELVVSIDASNDFLIEGQLFRTPAGYVCIDSSGSSRRDAARIIARSSDLINWEVLQSFSSSNPGNLVTDGTVMVASNATGLIRSESGRNWIQLQMDFIKDPNVIYVPEESLWVALGQAPDSQALRVAWTPDLESWEYADISQDSNTLPLDGMNYLNGVWLVAERDRVYTSVDLVNWVQADPPADKAFSADNTGIIGARVMGGRFVLLHHDGVFSSQNGVDWNFLYEYGYSPSISNSLYQPRNIRYVNGYYVYPSYPGVNKATATHIRSSDLIEWEEALGYQEMVHAPWALIGDVGLAYLDKDFNDNSGEYALYITYDGGETYTLMQEGGFSVNSIVATDDAFYISRYNGIYERSLIDLAIENTTISHDETPGADVPITIAFELINHGLVDYTRSGPLTITVMLAQSDQLEASTSIRLLAFELDRTLLVDESIQFSHEVLIPRSLPPGDYHLGVYVDSDDVLAELNEANNIYFSPVSLIHIPKVTLTINDALGGEILSESSAFAGSAFAANASAGDFSKLSGAVDLPYNIQLNLFAKPEKGYRFDGWEEFPNRGFEPLNLNLTSDLTLTPVFRQALSVKVYTKGKGSVVSVPSSLSDLSAGESVQLTAVPDAGWSFLKWEGGLTSSEAVATLQVDSSQQVRAVFYRNTLDYTAWKEEQFNAYQRLDAMVSDMTADPDKDGSSNIAEYLLRSDPNSVEDRPGIKVNWSAGQLEFEFSVDPRVTDFTTQIYSSTDLKNWAPEPATSKRTTPHSYDRSDVKQTAPIDRVNAPTKFYKIEIVPVE